MRAKLVEDLKESDFEKHPVWEFINDDALGETAVQPVTALPASTLSGRLVSTMVELANKKKLRAVLGNVSLQHPAKNEHFLTLTAWQDGETFHLARYFDSDYLERGPKALAKFLGMKIDNVFPISYDLTSVAKGRAEALTGEINETPKKRLSSDQIMALIFESRD